ncbi:DUF6056 family protein [Pontibacter harenae]|uniref:DUF6056 family protein n=1 Tax=Pontibacter harenae TaxID=2894083 RepID=UPI001E4712D7|nr:DUF6056 family protein [Pontibacter harenae]MCC9168856.1 DUF6056 family protein [Pontibacter harenae]
MEKNHQLFHFILAVFICCLIASLVVLLAPGNSVRQDVQNLGTDNLFWPVLASFFLILTYFYKWGVILVVSSILYLLLWGRAGTFSHNTRSLFCVPLWLSLLFYFVSLYFMNFAYTWAAGAVPKPRVENVIYFFFILGWFYNLNIAINCFANELQQTRLLSLLTAALLLLFTRLLLNIDNNISTAYLDLLSGKATNYNKELNSRYTFLETSNCNICIVEPLPIIPTSIFHGDITQKEDLPINKFYKEYWHKEGIYLKAPNPLPEDNNLETLRLIGRRIKNKLLVSEN